jgi:hypothetical protein
MRIQSIKITPALQIQSRKWSYGAVPDVKYSQEMKNILQRLYDAFGIRISNDQGDLLTSITDNTSVWSFSSIVLHILIELSLRKGTYNILTLNY